MAKSSVAPDYRTRETMISCLLGVRTALEAEGVRHAFLFGSVARGDDVPESDVDVIVDLDPAYHVGLFQLAGIATFLEEALGRRVDLGTRASLLPGRHDEILADLHPVF